MNETKTIYCVTPIYNDWESFAVLTANLQKLQETHAGHYLFSIIAVNDGSTQERHPESLNAMLPITVLDLKVNIGHQRAIAVGLQYVYNEITDYDYVVVLDSDGEDNPHDISRLIEAMHREQSAKIIFAQRQKRQESALFKI